MKKFLITPEQKESIANNPNKVIILDTSLEEQEPTIKAKNLWQSVGLKSFKVSGDQPLGGIMKT